MSTQDDACAMAFAVLRNRGYRFLAVSTDGVVVSNGSPTLAIDVSRPVHAAKEVARVVKNPKRKVHRKMPFGYVAKVTGYPAIMKAMAPGEHHLFPLVAGSTIQAQAMTLSNGATRCWGSGTYSIKSSPEGIAVTRK